MLKWLLIGFGGVSVVSGMLTFWLPLPIGIPLMLLGTTLLIRHSPCVRRRFIRLLQRHPHKLGFLRRYLREQRRQE